LCVPQNISKTYFKKFSKGRRNLAELALGFIFAVLQLKIGVAALVIRPRVQVPGFGPKPDLN